MITERPLQHHRIPAVLARYPSLESVFTAARRVDQQQDGALVASLTDVLECDHLFSGPALAVLRETLIAEAGSDHPRHGPLYGAIVLNTLGLVALTRPADVRALATLVTSVGHRTVTQVHDSIDRLVTSEPTLPWTTVLIRRLSSPAEAFGAGDEAAVLSEHQQAIRARAAVDLLVRGLASEAGRLADPILTQAGFGQWLDHGDAQRWRRQLAPVFDDPWCENAGRLLTFSDAVEGPGVARTVGVAVRRFRAAAVDTERREIAAHIGHLVRISGLPQGVFAERVGTSASRLSTYVHGQVTPSATLLLRMTRLAARQTGTAVDSIIGS